MSRDADDDDWLDSLAGRTPRPGADKRVGAEARQLGQALRRQAARRALEAVYPPTADSLLAAAVQAGPTARPGCRVCAWLRGLSQRPQRPVLALATAMALLLLVMPLRPPPEPDAPSVLRGAAGVQLVQDAQPLARRDGLAAHLASAGVPVRRYERLGRAGLYARLDAAQQHALAGWLKAERLGLAPDGELQVEVEAPR